jgi:hypothetical protein
MTNILINQVNVTNIEYNNFISPFAGFFPQIGAQVGQDASLLATLNGAVDSLENLLSQSGANPYANCLSPVSEPACCDCCHPSGSLKTDGNEITTPGGYKIKVEGNTNWSITTPDGKVTEIEGDPHVKEGDGGRWDFHDNSVFVLPDGTKIYANTNGGDGATVTTGLTVSTGNEHVTVNGVDQDRPQFGQVQNGAYLAANQFNTDDVYVLGGDGDDWACWANGREVIGSEDQGKIQKYGNPLSGTHQQGNEFDNFRRWIDDLLSRFNGYGNQRNSARLRNAFYAMASMLAVTSSIFALSLSLNAGRHRRLAV